MCPANDNTVFGLLADVRRMADKGVVTKKEAVEFLEALLENMKSNPRGSRYIHRAENMIREYSKQVKP